MCDIHNTMSAPKHLDLSSTAEECVFEVTRGCQYSGVSPGAGDGDIGLME